MITIYHNPRCGKSREVLTFLENSNIKFEVIKYLDTKFTYKTLKDILKKLDINPIELVRKNEKIWINNYKAKQLSDDEIINAMIENPTLIERPIAVNGNKAIVARPLDLINSIL